MSEIIFVDDTVFQVGSPEGNYWLTGHYWVNQYSPGDCGDQELTLLLELRFKERPSINHEYMVFSHFTSSDN